MGNENQTESKSAYVTITDKSDSAGVTALGNLQVDVNAISTGGSLNVNVHSGIGTAIDSVAIGGSECLCSDVLNVVKIGDVAGTGLSSTNMGLGIIALDTYVQNTASFNFGVTDIVAVEAILSAAPPDAIGGAVDIKWIIFRANDDNANTCYYGHNAGGAVMGLTPGESSNQIDVSGVTTLAAFEIDGTTGDKVQFIYGV